MPAESLWMEIGKRRKSMGWGELFDLKRIFGVSVQALTYRCKDLGIFGTTLFRLLFDEFSRQGWRAPPYREPDAMDCEVPRRFDTSMFPRPFGKDDFRRKGRRALGDIRS